MEHIPKKREGSIYLPAGIGLIVLAVLMIIMVNFAYRLSYFMEGPLTAIGLIYWGFVLINRYRDNNNGLSLHERYLEVIDEQYARRYNWSEIIDISFKTIGKSHLMIIETPVEERIVTLDSYKISPEQIRTKIMKYFEKDV
jgi:hypothetical protein